MRTAALLATILFLACSRPPSLITDARKEEILSSLQRQLARSVEGEKSAVLATTDEDSERFAAQSRQAAEQVDRLRAELRTLVTSAEGEKLDGFDAAWAKVAAIDAKLLPLATANTNLKAAKLSAQGAAASLGVVVAALASAEAVTKDPVRLREYAAASVAALRIQVLHSPHIASANEVEMTALEAKAGELERQVDLVLAPGRKAPPVEVQALSGATRAWADYQRDTQTVFALSRQNTNVLSFAISIHEKSEASRGCEVALQALVDQVHRAPTPTR